MERRFVKEIILRLYLQSLFYTIVFNVIAILLLLLLLFL